VTSAPFPIVVVSDWDVVADETSGVEEKYWLQEPDTGVRCLFKAATIKEGHHLHGEDWAEKTVAHLAGLLGMPCASIEMAEMNRRPGCISKDLRPIQYELQHGQVLLEECRAPGYVHGKGKVHPGHTLENIRSSLAEAVPPPGCELPFDATAYDVFAGYVLLDAWVANRDRHDNNWAVLRPVLASGGPLHLCGSYDHASSLGFNLTDQERSRRIAEGSVGTWAGRGTAWRFDYAKGTTLVDLAVRALLLASPDAKGHWTERLSQVGQEEVRALLARVPRMSDPARTFAEQVLDVNRRRVLDGCA
jgi:hypothetical protein